MREPPPGELLRAAPAPLLLLLLLLGPAAATVAAAAADFTMDTGPRRTQQLWLQLQQSFDQNRDGAITPLEYVDGFKALAMGQPLDMTAFARVPSTNLELLGCLQLSANVIVRNMTLQLFNTVGESLPPGAPTTPQAFWATSPTSVLLSLTGLFITDDSHKGLQKLFNAIDADKNGVLTAHDFAGKTFSSQHGAQRAQRRWALLQGAFDLNGDHQVTKEEFYTKFKELALAQPLIGFSRLPSSHTECIALLNHSTNHSIGKLAGEFVLALKNA